MQFDNYQPHQRRVIQEKVELDEKIGRLRSFIGTEVFDKLDEPEQWRLRRQIIAMDQYSEILRQRIAAFGVSHD